MYFSYFQIKEVTVITQDGKEKKTQLPYCDYFVPLEHVGSFPKFKILTQMWRIPGET